MIHNFRYLTLEDLEDEDERMEGNESKYFPQYIHLSNKRKQDLFGEWMDNIEHLDAYVSDKLANMEVDGESINYMDEVPRVLMLKEEGTHWEPAAIVKATTKLKDWAREGVTYPMEDLLEKIKTIEALTPTKNIISIPIESISTSIVNPVKSIFDCVSIPIKSIMLSLLRNLLLIM